jgi:hypothetical protein
VRLATSEAAATAIAPDFDATAIADPRVR